MLAAEERAPAAETPMHQAVRVGVVTLIAATMTLLAILARDDFRVGTLLRAGDLGPSAAKIREDFSADVLSPDATGLDGQQYYAIAATFPEIEAAEPYLDTPQYRLQRILAPAIASIGGEGAPVVLLLWSLNIVGLCLTCASLAHILARHGQPSWPAYFAAAPLALGVTYVTTEPLAFGLACAAMAFADRRLHLPAVTLFVAAGMAREVSALIALATAAGLGLQLVMRHRGMPPFRAVMPLVAYALPLAATLSWSRYLRELFGVANLTSRLEPLGFLDATGSGIVLAVAIIVVSWLGAWHWRHIAVLWPTALLFGLLACAYRPSLFIPRAAIRVSAPGLFLGAMAIAAIAATIVHTPARYPATYRFRGRHPRG